MFKNIPHALKSKIRFFPLLLIFAILMQIVLVSLFARGVEKIMEMPVKDFPLHLYMNPPTT